MQTANATAPDPFPDSYARRLLHRWLVEYNPLYLLSAALVLGGMVLVSRGIAREANLLGALGVAAVAEVYAAALIGGAALLMRLGHRRPAVMLAILTVLYQFDLTLHTETCAYLGTAGVLAALGWLALFVAKLCALGWAMKLRLSRGALATATLAGAGLAVMPLLLGSGHARSSGLEGPLVALWLVALVSLHRTARITSITPLDAWGSTVARRAVATAWGLSATLVTLHSFLWGTNHHGLLLEAGCVLPLLAVPRVRADSRAWLIGVTTLAAVALFAPPCLSIAALVLAAMLFVRALSPRAEPASTEMPSAAGSRVASPQPYRMSGPEDAPRTPTPATPEELAAEARAARIASARFVAGAVFALYLSLWTMGWSGGPLPEHILVLDLALTVAVGSTIWRTRLWLALAPLFATYVHLVVESHLVPAPQGSLEWGGVAVGLGFTLLLGSLLASYQLSRRGVLHVADAREP